MSVVQSQPEISVPEDLVIVGHITGAYGIKGWVRIRPYSDDADALLRVKAWWLDKPQLHTVNVVQAKDHSGDVVAHIKGINDRDLAESLKGTVVQVSRSNFPALPEDEFYWVDLIGLSVENESGAVLGTVKNMMDNGAHPILIVETISVSGQKAAVSEVLIPFVDQYIRSVNKADSKIIVDWGLDY